MPRLAKQLEDACTAQSHKFSLDEGYAVVNDLHSYASPRRGTHGATLAARLSSRWTTTRGLRELTDPHRLKLVLEMCIVAARHELATPEQAAALVDHMQAHPGRARMDLVAIVLDLTVRLQPAGGRAAVLALLSAVQRHHGDSPEALPCKSTDAALVLHRMMRLSLHEPLPGGAGSGPRGTRGAAAAPAAPALARLLTCRVATMPGDIHPALLVRAMHASSELLGFVFVPLMKVVVNRLSSTTSARTLSMDAVCIALQVLRSAKQLASYNKASGTILKSFTNDGDAGEEAQLAARKAADSSALPIPRERLCDAICNVLAVLALHLQRVLPEANLSAMPPPPRSLQQRVRFLPKHMQASASTVSTAEWIATLFETVVLDNWVVGHVAVGPELEWSQAATLRVVWKALVEESRTAPSPATPRTSGATLQRLLHCHAQHRQAVPEAASGMVASLLVPQLHSLTAEQLSHTIWALGQLRLRHGGLASALMQETRRHLDTLGAEQIAHVLASLVSLGINDRWLVRALGTAMLNRLHQGAPLRVALAVQSLKALAEYQECDSQLVLALHQRATHTATGGSSAKPRRLAPHLLADLALAVGDLHSHCGAALAPVPHVLALTTQAVTEAISGGRTQFAVEDLDKIRRFCVATGARELLPDIMVFLKRLASSPQPPRDGAATSARPHRSVETYLNSSRGQQVRREHETMPLHGRPLGFQDDASFAEPSSFTRLRSAGDLDTAELPPRPVAKPAAKPAVGRVPMRARPGRPSAAPTSAAAIPQPPKAPRVEAAQPPTAGMVDTRPVVNGSADGRPAALPKVHGAPALSASALASANSGRNADEALKAGPGRRGKLNTRDLKPRDIRDPDAVRAVEEFHDLMHSHAHGGKNAALDARAGATRDAAAVDPAQRAQQPAPAAVPEDVWSDSDFDSGQVADEALQHLRRPAGQHSVGLRAGGAVGGAARPEAPLKPRPAHHAAPAAEHISQAAIDAAAAEFALPGAGAEKAGSVDAELVQEEGPVEEALEALLLAPVDGGESWLDEIKRTGTRAGKGKKNAKAKKAGTSKRQRLTSNPASEAGSAAAAVGVEVTAEAVIAAEMAAEGRGVKPGMATGTGKARRQAVSRGDRESAVASVMSAVSTATGDPTGDVSGAGSVRGAPASEEGDSIAHGKGAAMGKGVASHPLRDVGASGLGVTSTPQVTQRKLTVDAASAAEAAAERAAAEAAAEEQAAAEAEAAVRVAVETAEARKVAAAVKAAAARKAAAEALAATRAAAEAAVAEKAASEAAAAEKAAVEAAAIEQAAEAAAAEKAAADAAAAEKAAAEAAAAEKAAAEAAAVERATAEAAAAQEAAAAAAARAAVGQQVQEQPQAVECEVVTDERYSEARQRWSGADMDPADFTAGMAASMAADIGDTAMPRPLQWEPGAVGDSEQGVWVDVRQLMWDLAEQDPAVHAMLEGMVGEDGDIPEEALDLITSQLMMEDGAMAAASFGGSSHGQPQAQQAGREDGSGRGFGGGGKRRRAVPRKHARQSAHRMADEVFEGAAEERRGGGGSTGGGGWEHPLPPGVNWSNGR